MSAPAHQRTQQAVRVRRGGHIAANPQTFTYDVLGRLTNGPLGIYTYGSSAHVHASTGIGTAWTSAYDATGNTICRTPSNSTTCVKDTRSGADLSRITRAAGAPGAP